MTITASSPGSVLDAASHRATAADFRDRVYLTTGWDSMVSWDGRAAALQGVGITGPSLVPGTWTEAPTEAAGTNGVTVGVHAFRYRYLDSRTGYVSNPSEERSYEQTTASKKWTFTIGGAGTNIQTSPSAKCDTIVLEATLASGEEFYEVARVANAAGSIVYDIADSSLAIKVLNWPSDGHDSPPVMRYVVCYGGRLWLFGNVVHTKGTIAVTAGSAAVTGTGTQFSQAAINDTVGGTWLLYVAEDNRFYEVASCGSTTGLTLRENYAGSTQSGASYQLVRRNRSIYYSRADFPESFPPLNFIGAAEDTYTGPLTAGIGFGESMIFFTNQGMFRFTYGLDPGTDGERRSVAGNRGAISQRVVVAVDTVDGVRLFGMDRLGWWVFDGISPTHISRAIEDLRDTINWDARDEFHAAFFPVLRVIRWYVCTGTDTRPKDYFQFDVDRQIWSTGELDVAITESALVQTADRPETYLGDENGHLWKADVGTVEGTLAEYSHLTVLAGAGTQTFGVSVDDEDTSSLPTVNVGLAGCSAYWVEGGELRVIQSNTGSTLTLLTAFSSAPAAGDRIWVGRIRAGLKTRAWVAPNEGLKNRAKRRYLHLYFEPAGSDRDLQVRVYENYSSTAKTYPEGGYIPDGFESSVRYPGKDSVYPATDYLARISRQDGEVRIGLGQEAARVIEIELVIDEPDFPLELIGIEVDGVEGMPPA